MSPPTALIFRLSVVKTGLGFFLVKKSITVFVRNDRTPFETKETIIPV